MGDSSVVSRARRTAAVMRRLASAMDIGEFDNGDMERDVADLIDELITEIGRLEQQIAEKDRIRHTPVVNF